jgi:hypothetical protein
VISGLIEAHGQGGSGYADKDWPYHNSFLIADRGAAYLLETSDRRCALRRVQDVGSASNHLGIGADWDALADGTIEHAIANGWWDEHAEARFDFAAAYRDTSMAPVVVSSGRHRRTCALLNEARGRLTPALLRSALRDHYGGWPRAGYAPDDERYFSVCMHAEPVGTTTAEAGSRDRRPAPTIRQRYCGAARPAMPGCVPALLCAGRCSCPRSGRHCAPRTPRLRAHARAPRTR